MRYFQMVWCFLTVALPEPPKHVVPTEVTSSSIKLTWSSRNSSTENQSWSDTESYIVQYRINGTVGDYTEKPGWKPEMTIVGLHAETAYEFRVAAINAAGRTVSAATVVVTDSHAGMFILLKGEFKVPEKVA